TPRPRKPARARPAPVLPAPAAARARRTSVAPDAAAARTAPADPTAPAPGSRTPLTVPAALSGGRDGCPRIQKRVTCPHTRSVASSCDPTAGGADRGTPADAHHAERVADRCRRAVAGTTSSSALRYSRRSDDAVRASVHARRTGTALVSPRRHESRHRAEAGAVCARLPRG